MEQAQQENGLPSLTGTAAGDRPDTLDVFGVALQVLAELGPGEDDACVIRGSVPPGVVVPLHSHADREVLYVLDGALDIFLGTAAQGSWHRLERGGYVDVAGGLPHALRGGGDDPVSILLVATRRIAELFREIGYTGGTAPPGPPAAERLAAFVEASNRRGYWLGNASENVAIGLMPG